jgi:hypothetical protein
MSWPWQRGALLNVAAEVVDTARENAAVPAARTVSPGRVFVSPPDAFELAVSEKHPGLSAGCGFVHLLSAVDADRHAKRLLRHARIAQSQRFATASRAGDAIGRARLCPKGWLARIEAATGPRRPRGACGVRKPGLL